MNIVIDLTTKQVLRSGECFMEINPLTEELIISSFVPTPNTIWKYENDIFIMDVLAMKKKDKILEVHEKTKKEEGFGIPYNNYRFSITAEAKANWLAVIMAKDSLIYPFSAPTGFGNIYEFQNVSDVLAFFEASMLFVKYWEQSDEELIIAIRGCSTIDDIDAIHDTRVYPF